jgi:hypothetical protein
MATKAWNGLLAVGLLAAGACKAEDVVVVPVPTALAAASYGSHGASVAYGLEDMIAMSEVVVRFTTHDFGSPRYNTDSGEEPYRHYATPYVEDDPSSPSNILYRHVVLGVDEVYKGEAPGLLVGAEMETPAGFLLKFGAVGEEGLVVANLIPAQPTDEPIAVYLVDVADDLSAAILAPLMVWRFDGATATSDLGDTMPVIELLALVESLTP